VLGYDAGPFDGVYGQKTAQAVSAFQDPGRPEGDGKVGPATRKRWRRRSASSPSPPAAEARAGPPAPGRTRAGQRTGSGAPLTCVPMTVPPPATATARHRWLGLALLSLGVSMIIVDATVVNVALPTIIGTSDCRRPTPNG